MLFKDKNNNPFPKMEIPKPVTYTAKDQATGIKATSITKAGAQWKLEALQGKATKPWNLSIKENK